jgi:hypothetical protein
MIIGKGIVIGLRCLINSSHFFFVIISFNMNNLWNHDLSKKGQNASMKEITTTAIKLGDLAANLKERLLESL